MHLIERDRLRSVGMERLQEPCAILHDRTRIITHMISQVKRRERTFAHATCSPGKRDAHPACRIQRIVGQKRDALSCARDKLGHRKIHGITNGTHAALPCERALRATQEIWDVVVVSEAAIAATV